MAWRWPWGYGPLLSSQDSSVAWGSFALHLDFPTNLDLEIPGSRAYRKWVLNPEQNRSDTHWLLPLVSPCVTAQVTSGQALRCFDPGRHRGVPGGGTEDKGHQLSCPPPSSWLLYLVMSLLLTRLLLPLRRWWQVWFVMSVLSHLCESPQPVLSFVSVSGCLLAPALLSATPCSPSAVGWLSPWSASYSLTQCLRKLYVDV